MNAAKNILAAGHAVMSVEGGRSKGRPMKQKTCDLREKVAYERLLLESPT